MYQNFYTCMFKIAFCNFVKVCSLICAQFFKTKSEDVAKDLQKALTNHIALVAKP